MHVKATFVKHRTEPNPVEEGKLLLYVDKIEIEVDGSRKDIDATLNLLIHAGWKIS